VEDFKPGRFGLLHPAATSQKREVRPGQSSKHTINATGASTIPRARWCGGWRGRAPAARWCTGAARATPAARSWRMTGPRSRSLPSGQGHGQGNASTRACRGRCKIRAAHLSTRHLPHRTGAQMNAALSESKKASERGARMKRSVTSQTTHLENSDLAVFVAKLLQHRAQRQCRHLAEAQRQQNNNFSGTQSQAMWRRCETCCPSIVNEPSLLEIPIAWNWICEATRPAQEARQVVSTSTRSAMRSNRTLLLHLHSLLHG
jgi:hypothetical protein